jgi:hypothetical protein
MLSVALVYSSIGTYYLIPTETWLNKVVHYFFFASGLTPRKKKNLMVSSILKKAIAVSATMEQCGRLQLTHQANCNCIGRGILL